VTSLDGENLVGISPPVRQSVRIYQEILSEEYVKKTIWAGDWYTFCHHLLYILQPNMEVTRYNKNVSGRAIFLRLLGSLLDLAIIPRIVASHGY
jgi:hypothetical protein